MTDIQIETHPNTQTVPVRHEFVEPDQADAIPRVPEAMEPSDRVVASITSAPSYVAPEKAVGDSASPDHTETDQASPQGIERPVEKLGVGVLDGIKKFFQNPGTRTHTGDIGPLKLGPTYAQIKAQQERKMLERDNPVLAAVRDPKIVNAQRGVDKFTR